jgi:hypothetical protein
MDVHPFTSITTLASNPLGFSLKLDGQTVTSPFSFKGASKIHREVEAVSPQTVGGVTYVFSSWSDGGARVHTLKTPATNTTLTANFVRSTSVLVAGGIYELESQYAPGKCLDVWAAYTGDKGVVTLWERHGGITSAGS